MKKHSSLALPSKSEVLIDENGFIGYVTEVFGMGVADLLQAVCHLHAVVVP